MNKNKKPHNGLPTRKMDHITAYLMILPAFGLLSVFVIYPLYMAVTKSFTNWTFYQPLKFIGLENFRQIITSELFVISLQNVLKFLLMIVPTQMILCFLFAHVIKNLSGPFASITKVSIYIPTVISGVVAAVIFIFILDYRAGVLNEFIKLFGMKKVAFLTDKTLATLAIIIPAIWLGFGSNTLIMYAGLLNIPKEYYEAAQVDGANSFVQLIRITIPSMKNIFVLTSIGMVTGTIQMFDLPFVMTNGGPLNRTLTPMIFLFHKFRDINVTMGFTLAGAILMMIVIGIVNSFVFNIITSEKSQDA